MLNKGDRVIIEMKDERYNLCTARVDKPSGQTINMSCTAFENMILLKKIEEVKS